MNGGYGYHPHNIHLPQGRKSPMIISNTHSRAIAELDREIAEIDRLLEKSVKKAAIEEYNIKGFLICGDVYTYVNEDDKLKNPIIGEATVTIEDGLRTIIKEFRFEMNTDDNRTKITETVDTY